MPKLMAWHKDAFTGDIYDFTIVSGNSPDPNDAIRVYTLLRPAKFSAVSDGLGRMLVMFSEEYDDLKPLMEIRNFRDSAGRELYEGGRWLMTEYEPILNIFNRVHAYRTRAALNPGGN